MPSSERSRFFRFSIRWKLLLLLTGVLFVAVGAYLRLATGLFRSDKLVYVFDLQGALASSLAEQSRSRLRTIEAEVTRVAEAALGGSADRRALFDTLFAIEPDLVLVQIHARVPGEDDVELIASEVNAEALAEAQVTKPAFEEHLIISDLPVAAVASGSRSYLINSSLPPDLPLLTMVAPYQAGAGRRGAVVAVWRPQQLLSLHGDGPHETALINEHGEVLAHREPSRVIGRADRSDDPLVKRALAMPSEVSTGVVEVEGEVEGGAQLGAYARVGFGDLMVTSQTSKARALRASEELVRRSTYVGLAILAGAVIVSILFTRLLLAPLSRLRAATREIGRGNFDTPIDVRTGDEIGDLADDFRAMTRALKDTEAQLIQSEKLAAFGQLGAGITHEVKGPLTGIIGLAQAAKMSIDDADAREMLGMIEAEGKRCTEILNSFLRFARNEKRGMNQIDLGELVRSASALFRHQLNIGNVTLRLDISPESIVVIGNAGELQQVLTNLAINAHHAMSDGGILGITVRREDGGAVLEVTDTGEGMSEEVRSRIFEPFFTTKPAGQGTGLGLSVTYGIIRDHRGRIDVESVAGQGTRFRIWLPPATPDPVERPPE